MKANMGDDKPVLTEDSIPVEDDLVTVEEVSEEKINAAEIFSRAINNGEYPEWMLYDNTPRKDNPYDVDLNPNVHPLAAQFIEYLAPMTRGVIFVDGFIGQGKGLFTTFFMWMLRYLFGKRVACDEPLRKEFDSVGVYPEGNKHIPYNETVIYWDLQNVKREAMSRGWKSKDLSTSKLQNMWLSNVGMVRYQNAVIGISELRKVFYRRQSNDAMNRATSGLVVECRHMDTVLIGGAPKANEIDPKSCLQYLFFEVHCEWFGGVSGYTRATIKRIRSISSNGMMESIGKKWFIEVPAKEPIPYLGGLCWGDLYNTQSKRIGGV